uniref:Uncharacterized protein n=1 Tax=Loa loa TaxID=7209 RepID=A0A1I7W0D0_LOALO
MGATSELYLTNLRIRNGSTRLLHLDFVGDIGMLRKQTYADLSTRNIPTFGDEIRKKNEIPTTKKYAENTKKKCTSGLRKLKLTVANDGAVNDFWFIKDIKNDMKESEKKLDGNMAKTLDITLPNSTDSELFWETNIPEIDENEENTMLDVDDRIYDNEMGNRRGTKEEKDVFQLPQQVNTEKNIATSAAVDHSEMTSPLSATLRSNFTSWRGANEQFSGLDLFRNFVWDEERDDELLDSVTHSVYELNQGGKVPIIDIGAIDSCQELNASPLALISNEERLS